MFRVLSPCLLLLSASLALGQQARFDWQTAQPAGQGMSAEKLQALQDSLAAKNTKALLVIRNDRIVWEWYAADHSATKTHYTASMAKALVGGVAVGVALTDGLLNLDDPAAKYIPEWKGDPLKSKITLRQLGSHSSGVEDAEVDNIIPHDQLTGWKGDFWKRLPVPNDPFTVSRDKAPVLFEPGSKSAYSNPGIALLTYCTTVALKDAPHKDVRTLLRERVMRPIGVPENEWSIGYGQTSTVAGVPLVGSWGGGNYTARTAARIGRLMLRGGNWDGQQLLAEDAVREITSDAGFPGPWAIGWWTNNSGLYPKLPKDAFWAAGAGNQILLVVPSLQLIAVRNGGNLSPAREDRSVVNTFLFEPLVAAVTGQVGEARQSAAKPAAPYPPSKLIVGIEWAPKESIVRKAKGGDNWPLTWADDDHQYTAYGDGFGFEPQIKQKLSLGLCRVEGGPANFTGINLRSETAEKKGEGMHGQKASGLLMVDGVLYLLTRNASNAQLAWSKDHGQSWIWADWKFTTSFGCPTFLNFGKNYAGARDEFVYVYSPDGPNAYEPANQWVLARVPKTRITEQAAYEYFQKQGGETPVWTQNIDQRGGVFRNPGNCYRSGITYNAGLKRYLWCQILTTSTHPQGPRFQGGFGIYDAPQPWGPWTTAFYTTEWDVGPGETSSLPTKWMSADGRTVHLAFSGDDYFSVRQAKLNVTP